MRFILSILLASAAVFTLCAAEEVLRADRWGFDSDDSTEQLQKALDSGAKKIIIPKMKSPWIAAKQLRLPGNCEIVFEDGAEILAKEGKFQNRVEMLLLGKGISGLKIRGKGILTMRRAVTQYTIRRGKNVTRELSAVQADSRSASLRNQRDCIG